jgi:hypothetical protein
MRLRIAEAGIKDALMLLAAVVLLGAVLARIAA